MSAPQHVTGRESGAAGSAAAEPPAPAPAAPPSSTRRQVARFAGLVALGLSLDLAVRWAAVEPGSPAGPAALALAAVAIAGSSAWRRIGEPALTLLARLLIPLAAVVDGAAMVAGRASPTHGWAPTLVVVGCALLVPSRRRALAPWALAAAALPALLAAATAALAHPLPPGWWSACAPPAAALALVLAGAFPDGGGDGASRQAAGRRFGEYDLIELLGRGGMGEVWRAEHRLLGRPAAVKLIRVADGQAPTPEAVLRFEREARMTARLESPHAVRLYDFGVAADGALFLVMELLRGCDLERLVLASGPLVPARAVHLLVQACDALHEAHELGLVHRDVKPTNFFVRRRARYGDWLTVLDFGLGLELRSLARGDGRLTAVGHVTGTPAYMAPEIARARRDVPIDHRADIYALGCVAYFLLSGREVFTGASAMEVVAAQVVEAPPRLDRVARRPLPPRLVEAVMACLAKDPAERPASATILAQLLVDSLDGPAWTVADAEAWWNGGGVRRDAAGAAS